MAEKVKLSPIMIEALHTLRLRAHQMGFDDVSIGHIGRGTAKALKKRGMIEMFLVPGGVEFCRLTEAGRNAMRAGAEG